MGSLSGDKTPWCDVTELLRAWSEGQVEARDRLFLVVYDQLRRLAAAKLRGERPSHTLQPTALVHEAFMDLANSRMSWKDRGHFFAVVSEAMRRVLVDHARARRTRKRGDGKVPLALQESMTVPIRLDEGVIELDEALSQLRTLDPRQAQVVDLRFFCGLSVEETAQALQLSPATIKREWSTARVWLYHRLRKNLGRAHDSP